MSPQPGVPFPRSGSSQRGTERAWAMRLEFDASFARPPRQPDHDLEDVLALRLGEERCVLRLCDLAGVIAHPLITPVPTLVPALLGLLGNRGSVLAAYDLSVLRGGSPAAPRWLVISAAETSVGVTFEHFDGYRRITRGCPDSGRLIELATVVESIRALLPAGSSLQHQTHYPQSRSGD